MKPTPHPITVNTGEECKLAKTVDDFFADTVKFLENNYHTQGLYFEIKSGGVEYQMNAMSNDRITYLSYKDYVLAGVLKTRTEFNHVHYTFFRNLRRFYETAPKK